MRSQIHRAGDHGHQEQLSNHLWRHAPRTPIVDDKGVGVQQSVALGVSEAADKLCASRRTQLALERRGWTRDKNPVVARCSFHRPSVFACRPGAEAVFVYFEATVDGSPQLVLFVRDITKTNEA